MGTAYLGLILTVFLLCICTGVSVVTNLNDAAILSTLKLNWGNTAPQSWSGSDPCRSQWVGVNCTNSGQIISLILSAMNLQGNLPPDIGHLTALQTLDLSYNGQLIGPLPQTLGSLTNLQSLSLIECNFTGTIPDSLGNLVNLQFLALNSNKLRGSIPSSLGYLINLTWLDLSDNQLTGTLPVSNGSQPGLDKLRAAQHLHFNKNRLSGSIPSNLFSADMELLHVLFDSNDFSGEIPSTLGLVQTLEALRLDRNSLVVRFHPTSAI